MDLLREHNLHFKVNKKNAKVAGSMERNLTVHITQPHKIPLSQSIQLV